MNRAALFLITMLFINCSNFTTEAPVSNSSPGTPPESYAESDNYAQSVSSQLIQANLEFALSSFHELNIQESPTANIFYSPLSLSMILAMTYNGAAGATAQAMAAGMNVENWSIGNFNQQYNNLILSLMNPDIDIILQTANSMWLDTGYPLNTNFQQTIIDYYLSQIANLPFIHPATVETINNWISNHTNGLIDNVVSYPLPEAAVFVLVNALYFRGHWTYQFDPAETVNAPFFNAAGTVFIPTMRSAGEEYTYFYGNGFKAVRMPYGRGVISMYIFLPDVGTDIDEFIASLTAADLNQCWNSFQDLNSYWGTEAMFHKFYLPKFKVEYEKVLNNTVETLGMGIIFSDASDFTGISIPPHDPWIALIKQKAFIEVNEEGTEAAAATIEIGLEGELPEFIINRPFFFLLRDDRSGSILFIGKIVEPQYD